MTARESQRITLIASLILLGLSVALAIPFWAAAFQHLPELAPNDAPKAAAFLAGVLIVMLVSLGFVGRMVWQAWRRSLTGLAVIGLVASFAYLFASLVSYFLTPALGGPLVLFVLLFAGGSKLAYARRATPHTNH